MMAAEDSTHLTLLFQSCRVWRTLSLLKYIYCVLVFSHTTILLDCGDVRIPKLKKTATEYLRLKTELNRTNILKSKPTQPLKMKN